ncbi:MAG TPA: hypothetical protein VI299_05010 [Polyangiales bacterium]
MKTRQIGYAVSLLLSVGCAAGQGQRVQDARVAEIDARKDAQLAALDAQTEARSQRIEQSGDRHAQNVEAAGTPGAESRAEMVEISVERAQYENDAKGRLDRLAARLQAAHQKTKVLGNRAPTSLMEDLEAAQTQHKLLRQQIAELQATEPAAWAQRTSALNRGMDTLEQRIEGLSASIDDV